MKNERITPEVRQKILEMREDGMRVPEIADKLNLSDSGVYRVIQMARVVEKPIVDDSKVVKELKEKISALEADNRRLLAIIDRLVK